MNRTWRALIQLGVLVAVIALLIYLFPRADAFVEMAARELRYFWWMIFVVALAVWLIFGLGRRRR